jgi:ribokinase
VARSVVVVGSLNVDVIVHVPELPAPGQTVLGGTLLHAAGGKGANQAVAAARLGAAVRIVGRVGRDGFAAIVLDSLVEASVAVDLVARSEAPTGVALIVVNARGENLIAVASGANAELSAQDVTAVAAALSAADVVVAQLETPLASVASALRLGRAGRALTILNCAPAQPVDPDLLALADVLVANEHELGALLGQPVPMGEEGSAAARLRQAEQVVIVTLGARGAVAAGPTGVQLAPGLVVDAVDTVGAGDAFVGALAVAYAGPNSLADALRFANVSGALAATRPGAQPAMPRLAEVQAMLAASRGAVG